MASSTLENLRAIGSEAGPWDAQKQQEAAAAFLELLEVGERSYDRV